MSKKENTITVLVVEPEKKPYVKEIENTLESLQREVGGYIRASRAKSVKSIPVGV